MWGKHTNKTKKSRLSGFYVRSNTKGAANVNYGRKQKELPMHLFKEKVTVIQDLNRFPGDFSPTFQDTGKLSDKSEGCLSSSPGQTHSRHSAYFIQTLLSRTTFPQKEKSFQHNFFGASSRQ